MASRKEIRDEVLSLTDQINSQKGTLVNDAINATILEIANPAWAYSPRKEVQHNWSWLRRATSFTTTASTEDYVLPREVGDIILVRHISPDRVLDRMTDEKFYKMVPDPQDTGDPYIYRVRSIEGISTKLAVADTIDIVSTSTSDDGDADLSVTVWGYSSGIIVSETYILDGTTTVAGTVTFDAREIYVSKQKDTTGNITVKENSGGVTLLTLGKQERNPIFKVISLYNIPSGAKTVHVHFYTHPRILKADSDSPQFHEKWHYVVRLGALAKVYFHLNKEESARIHQSMYSSAVRSMVSADQDNPDERPRMDRRNLYPLYPVRRSEDAIA